MMTARKPAKPSAHKKVAKTQDPEPPDNGWPAVVRFALEDWPRTVRLCAIGLVFGVLLLLAMRLGPRL
jgi:hypothetical protein